MAKRQKRNKERDQKTFWHLQHRFRQRFGIKLDERLNNDIIEQIMYGNALLCDARFSEGVIYIVEVGDQDIKVVFNKGTGKMITAVPILY